MNHPLSRRAALGLSITGALAAGAAKPSRAQSLNRVARIINGFPPGGASDNVARLYAEHMRGVYAPQVIVEARSGAGGRLALEAAKGATPDGTTLVHMAAGQFTIYPHIYRRLAYDLSDFIPVSPVVSYPQSLVVKADHPARNLAEFTEWAKRRNGEISYGTPGAGTWTHFMTMQIARALGLGMTHVPYRGTAPALQDLLGGQIHAVSCTAGDATELYRAGALRILGISAPERAPRLPEIMTYAEQGYPELTSEEWFGLFLPARTPGPVVEAAYQAVLTAAAKPELRAALERMEYRVTTSPPAEFAARVRAERDHWGPVVAASGFQAEE
ncbi:Tripartite-type tricarboxylate transporter, receptor component TctC [Roseomonas rosea]|uniref:Tripartite-type tricarboxylate transporter, receptor component TctC n=1 Tax=Muricoccus roseus TaxID=198092 RepID=A0A1M6PT47_9PROT|nr:tripartite tricarboxylate transporter substrate-binding protein [Roseomonas rosea]SHK11081.1 Tripartite-type tricarboxylate transporter, receptor component TctC [Roseomonas rosea]